MEIFFFNENPSQKYGFSQVFSGTKLPEKYKEDMLESKWEDERVVRCENDSSSLGLLIWFQEINFELLLNFYFMQSSNSFATNKKLIKNFS